MQATTTTVGALLRQTSRDPATPHPWPAARVGRLLDDLGHAIIHAPTPYHLGTVRIAAVGAHRYLIDGRRRLSILDLLLLELRAVRIGHHHTMCAGDHRAFRVIADFCDDLVVDLDPGDRHCATARWIDFVENRVLVVVVHNPSTQLAA